MTQLGSSVHQCSHTLNSLTANIFASVFAELSKDMVLPSHTNDVVHAVNNLCLSTIDIVAPPKIKSNCSVNSFAWMNEELRCLKREYRKVEGRWKNTRL